MLIERKTQKLLSNRQSNHFICIITITFLTRPTPSALLSKWIHSFNLLQIGFCSCHLLLAFLPLISSCSPLPVLACCRKDFSLFQFSFYLHIILFYDALFFLHGGTFLVSIFSDTAYAQTLSLCSKWPSVGSSSLYSTRAERSKNTQLVPVLAGCVNVYSRS